MNLQNKSIIAITGPSGAGKTTLGDKLALHNEIRIPVHCTTRDRRSDDRNGFYRYLSHDEYSKMFDENKFLLSSGDGPTIKKEYGNFYGVLFQDCLDAWANCDIIVLFVSYKDIERLNYLNENYVNIDIVNLTFNEIESSVRARISNSTRNHTEKDIENRIKCAISDTEKYGEALRMYAKCMVYTDILDINQTYEKVCTDLGLRR